jgi:hypothetical protein
VKLRELIWITHDDSNTWISGWWYTYPSEKYESQLGLLFPIYGKIKFMFQTTNQIYMEIRGSFTVPT